MTRACAFTLRRREDERGAVAVIVTAFMVVMLGLCAVVVDLGNARDVERQAQNAADAGALAGATCMAAVNSGCNTTAAAIRKARDYVIANGWDGNRSTVAVDTTARTVSVVLPAEQQPTFFAGALGQGAPAVARSAVATWSNAGSGCSLCVIGDVNVSANADVLLDQGDLLVGGNLVMGPNSQVVNTAGRLYVTGTVTGGGLLRDVTGILLPSAVPSAGTVAGPVVDLSAVLGQVVAPSPSGACVPGTYAAIDGCTSFSAGLYVLTGSSTFTGNSSIQANAVTFVMACSGATGGVTRSAPCSPGQRGGEIALKGGVALSVGVSSPPLYVGICLGFAIIADPNNTGTLSVQGNAQLTVAGSVFLNSGTLDYGGRPDLNVSGQMIVGKFTGNGNTGTLHLGGCGTASVAGAGGGVHLLR